MHDTYDDHVGFLTIYIKEAHPLDEWQMESNEKDSVCYPQPRSLGDRARIAADFVERFGYNIPMAVDPIDNPADHVYAGWPERLYIIDEHGVIVYKGETGPFGFHPEEVESWLQRKFPDAIPAKQS